MHLSHMKNVLSNTFSFQKEHITYLQESFCIAQINYSEQVFPRVKPYNVITISNKT